MHKHLIAIAFLMLANLTCSGDMTKVVAKVNGEPIYAGEYKHILISEVKKYDSKTISNLSESLKKKVLDDLIDETIQYLEAKNKGISLTEKELSDEYNRFKGLYSESAFQQMLKLKGIKYNEWKERRKRSLMIYKLVGEEVFSKIEISDKDIKDYYKKNLGKFKKGYEVRARQIVVDSKDLAKEVRKKILSGENFAALANEYSITPEGSEGGDLGWFEKGVMPAAFDKACFNLPVSGVSKTVTTEFGYHIFKVIGKRGPSTTPLEEVKDRIVLALRQERVDEAFKGWFEPLKKQAEIVVYDEVYNKIDLAEVVK